MKTLIFLSEFVTNNGGVPQTIIDLVRGLAISLKFKIILLCPKNSEMAQIEFPPNVHVRTTLSTNWFVSRSSIWRTVLTIVDLYLRLRKILNKKSWVITNHSVSSALLSLMPFFHINEIYINRGGDFNDAGFASRLMRRKISKSKIRYGIGISQRQVNLLLDSGMAPDSVFLVHDGLTLPSCTYAPVNLNKLNLRISTIGFISDLKNQIEGVRLIKLLRDNGINASLNIYGSPITGDDYYQRLIHVIEELNLNDYINIKGFVSGESLFGDTDVLVSFSRSEGFGRTLVEGMLRRKPIIAWRGAGGPVDITDNGKYGYLVENNTAAEYCEIISELMNNPQSYYTMIENAFSYAYDNFTIYSMNEKYINLFHRICN